MCKSIWMRSHKNTIQESEQQTRQKITEYINTFNSKFLIAVTEIHMLKTKNEDAIICGNETIIQNRNDRTKG